MPTFVQELPKRDRVDDVRFWAEEDVIRQPIFDTVAFQKKIDKICGKSRDGYSIIRLKWAWDKDCFSEFYTDWNAEGSPIKSELRAKYRYKTIEIDSLTSVDIAPPRWILEERIDPAQYLDAWEANRWQYNALLQRPVVQRPSAPRDGYYTLLYQIASHDPEEKCCARAFAAEQECFGVYRKPGEWDLLRLKRLKYTAIESGKMSNPYEPLSAEVFEQIQAETESVERERYEQKMSARDDKRKEYTDIAKPSAAFSLPNETVSAGGIIIPG